MWSAGCLREAWINHKRVDFVNAARTQRTAAGCGDDEPPAPPQGHTLQEDGGHYQVPGPGMLDGVHPIYAFAIGIGLCPAVDWNIGC